MSKTTIDFTLGADPEFGVADSQGRIISGEPFIQDANHPEILNDIGLDGNGVTLEVRPAPSANPLEVVSNIRGILRRQVQRKPAFLNQRWIAGSYYGRYPFGGHIHFGGADMRRKITSQDASAILDQYLGAVSILIEDRAEGMSRRREGRYGHRSNWRPQNHGFEYRVPSSWIVSPYVAASMMCLSKTVMHEALNNTTFPFGNYVDDHTFSQMRTAELKASHWGNLWKDIQKMELYQLHKPYLDLIYFLVQNKLTWFPKRGMKEAWGIANEEVEAPSDLDLEVIWLRHFQTVQAIDEAKVVSRAVESVMPQVGVQLPNRMVTGAFSGFNVSGVIPDELLHARRQNAPVAPPPRPVEEPVEEPVF